MQTPIGRDGHCQIVPLARDGEEITTRGDQRLSDEVETAFQVTVPLQIEQLVKKLTLDRFPQHAVCVEEHLKQHAIQNSFSFLQLESARRCHEVAHKPRRLISAAAGRLIDIPAYDKEAILVHTTSRLRVE